MYLIRSFFAELAQDTRYTARQLRRSPFFSITMVLTLTLAIGATAAMVGVLRATLLNPLPYARAGELVRMEDVNLTGEKSTGFMAVPRIGDLVGDLPGGHPLFASLGYFYSDDSSLTLDGHNPLRVAAVAVSGGFFPTLQATPLLGRTLLPADDVRNGAQVVVISRKLWQTAFAADPAIIGRLVRLGKQQATVVGVMDTSFAYPAGIDLWHPGGIFPSDFAAPAARGDGSRWMQVIARLAPGVTLAETRAAADALALNLASAFPVTDKKWGFRILPLRDSLFGEYRKALTLLSLAVGLVLVLAAVNLAGLQLSRNAGREAEFALRTALGISRARLVRQLLTESILLVLTGAALGLGLASGLLHLLAVHLPATLIQAQTPKLDLAVFLLAFAVALVVGVLTGALPAWQATRLASSASERSVVGGASGRTRLFGRSFTILEIALSLMLLGISASVLRSLYALVNTPLGFDAAHLETFTVDLPWGIYGDQPHQLYASLEQQFLAIPGVTSAGSITALPLTGVYNFRNVFDIVGRTPTPQHDTVIAEGRSISPGYLATLRIPLLAGRNFTAHDASTAGTQPLLVNEALANRYFPGQSALGKRFLGLVGPEQKFGEAGEIVGVIGDVRGDSEAITAPVRPEVFFAENGGWPHMQFALRATQPLAAQNPELEAQIRRIVRQSSAIASAGHFATLSGTLDRTLAQPRLNASLLTSFALLSLLLVVIGVYGLVAFDVAQRTRELGLRMALGSSRTGVVGLLLGEALRVLGLGLAGGLAASLVAAKLLASLTAGGSGPDLLLTLGTAAVLGLAVLAATYLPARRASQLDPMQALKTT